MVEPTIFEEVSAADQFGGMDTPSPTASHDLNSTTPDDSNGLGSSSSAASNSASRRPPRKSTLTQQQKNQKRQRATQDQLVTLEHEFSKNPTPNAATRERIAQEINMTERSVQIWFQNSRRRAKIKLMAKKGGDVGDELDYIPDAMRQRLAMQAMQEGKPFPAHLMGRAGGPLGGFGNNMLVGDPNANSKTVIHHFACRSLSIGSWRRVGQNAMDLVIFYSPDKACITYYINNDSAGYKIEYPFAFIKDISLESADSQPATNGAPPRLGGLVIQLTRPPNFFMDSSGQGFYQCGDFTEDQQASQILTHHLGGHPKDLSGQLARLVSLESYQNRHSPFDFHPMPASAPVSPNMGIARPASQPNGHFARPHPPQHNMFHDQGFAHPGLHPGRMPQGHKRQRSRSVPIAIDFSMLHGPMPTFHIQQPSPQEFNPQQTPFFHHPVPQHPGQQQMSHNLQIDTSAGFGLEMRQMPMSATATTPSEFASPGFFPSHPQSTPHPQNPAEYNTNQFSGPYLSPSPMVDPSHMIPAPSHTPLSHVSHPEPQIANHSPPLGGLHRSASADVFSMHHDQHGMNDESLMLTEMYSKQNLNMQIPSPSFDENGILSMPDMSDFHTPQEHLDIPLTPFTVDPNSLGMNQ